VKFLIDNAILIVAAAISGFMLLWPKLAARGSGDSAVSPLEATQLINHRNAIIVDLRDEQAFAAGSLANARHLPQAQLKERAAELVRFKARPVVLLCLTGQDSARAVATFKGEGFEEAYALAGGIQAWQKAGLPLVQARDNTPVREAVRKGKSDNRQKGVKRIETRIETERAPDAVVEPVVADVEATTPDPAGDAPTPAKAV
jgi:rhodanese-related sulfurtransferase